MFNDSLYRVIYSILFIIVTTGLQLQAGIADWPSIKGRVLDEKNHEPLVGVGINVKGTQTGASSNLYGYFEIRLNKEFPVTLIVSYLGYKTQEIYITENDSIKVFLTEDVTKLNEVVIIGYGSQKRKELTGAISSLPKSTLQHVTSSFDEMLGGAVAGVNVTRSSGQPGSAPSIRIRGGNSVYAKNDPLYVIDGFIYYSDYSSNKAGLNGIEGTLNPLASINPGDIESIDILKDVSATAIYGSRGANGVIIITTKRGRQGSKSLNYHLRTGWNRSSQKIDLLNASEWARIQKDYFNNKGNFTDEEISALGEGYNWQDAVLKTGFSQSHEISLNGGDKTRYAISGNYTNEKGIVINSGMKRFGTRINLDSDLTDKILLGISVNADRVVQNSLTTFEDVNYNDSPYSHGITNSLTYALYIPPVVPVYNNNGAFNYDNPYEYDYLTYYGKTANPVSDLKNSIGQTISSSLLASFSLKYILLRNLVLKINTGTNSRYTVQNFFAPSYTAIGLEKEGIGGIGNKRTSISQMDVTLNYTKKLADIHSFQLLTGYTFQNTNINYAINLTSHLLTFKNLAAGSNPYPPFSNTSSSELHSVIARLNYTLMDRYNLSLTFRGDESSRFSKGNRWGYFPSAGFSWNINNESFMENFSVISSLKIRATYGTVGNSEIGDYEYSQYFTASIYNGQVAYNVSNTGNSSLKWETTSQVNAGFDAGFFNDRINVGFDMYSKKTIDLLLKIPVDPWSGSGELQMVNLGSVTNKGFELAISYNIINDNKTSLTVSANAAHNSNTITDMGNYTDLKSGRNQEQILKVDASLGSFYGLIFDGIVQKEDDVSSLPVVYGKTPEPGDIKFKDIKPDGKIDNDDRVVLGSIQPDLTYGFSTSLKVNRFDFYLNFQGSQGNEIYNLLRRYLERPTDSYNMSAEILNSWTENNPTQSIPKIGSPVYSYLDSRYVEDASFLKLKNFTMGYTFPLRKQENSGNFRLYASLQNILTISKYKGYDPEVAGGIDLGTYPSSKSFILGLDLKL
jgi:TonB-linked SusC/RagA family outer membrane protein